LFQLALIAWIFSGVRFYNSIATGIADSQLALAVVIFATCGIRWSLKLPIALGLVGAACLAHYICLVDLWYPFVFAEEYLISLLGASSIWLCFFMWRRIGNLRLANENSPPYRLFSAWRQFSIGDLLIWTMVVGGLIAIGRSAIAKNGDVELFDWARLSPGIVYSRGFSSVEAPSFLLRRIPLLAVALVAHAIAWTAAMRILLGTPWRWRRLADVTTVLIALSITEVAIATVTLLFEMRWPILPASELVSTTLVFDLDQALRNASTDNLARIWNYSRFLIAIFLSRVVVFGGSLLLLRGAGWRLVKRTQPTDGHSAEHASPSEAAAI
jgi:hypothetical protein